MCKKKKRINFDGHEGPTAGVELSTSSDGLTITPVNSSGKPQDAKSILVPLSNLDEFAQSVQNYLEEVERHASGEE